MNDQTNTPKFNRGDRSGYGLRRVASAKPKADYDLRQNAGDARSVTRSVSRLGRCADQNDENSQVNVREQRASRRRFGSESIENYERMEKPATGQGQSKKRRLFSSAFDDELIDEQVTKYVKCRMKDCVFIELHPTGFERDEEIIKFVAYHPTSSAMIGNFSYPTSPNKKVTHRMTKLTGIEVDCKLMLSDNELVAYSDIGTILEEFVELIESLNSDNIVLVYENQFALKHIPCILAGSLMRFDLLQRIEGKIVGFVDCNKVFGGDDGDFDLDHKAKRFKSRLLARDMFYRLDVLSKYFHANRSLQVESILKLEDFKAQADDYRLELKQRLAEIEPANEDSFEEIMQQAKTINETKEYLTTNELRGLYLLQKLKYQYILSKTYKPKKKFPKTKPTKKGVEKRTKSFGSDSSDQAPNVDLDEAHESILSQSLAVN